MLIALLIVWTVAIPAVIVGVTAWCAWRRERPEGLAARGISVGAELVGTRGAGAAQPTR